MRTAFLSVIALALGCAQPLPEPVIHSVQPAEFEEGQAPLLQIDFDATLPFSVDYDQGTATIQAELSVLIGETPLELEGPLVDGRVSGVAPFGLTPGTYDVTVILADGRRGTLVGGLQVLPGQFPERFAIDPLPEQKRGQPFDVTIRAEGPQAAQFNGVVRLSVSKGSISPEFTGAFVAGVRTERVTIDAPASEIVLTVEDAAGHSGTSAPFRVRP